MIFDEEAQIEIPQREEKKEESMKKVGSKKVYWKYFIIFLNFYLTILSVYFLLSQQYIYLVMDYYLIVMMTLYYLLEIKEVKVDDIINFDVAMKIYHTIA